MDKNKIIAYHGTNSKFNQFKNTHHDIGYWFSTDREYAKSHGKYLLSVDLNLNNVLDLDNLDDEDIFLNLVRMYYNNELVSEQKFLNDEEFGKFLDNSGYDAICWSQNEGITYIVFNKNCIEIKR